MFKKVLFSFVMTLSFTAQASDYGVVFSEEAPLADRWKDVYKTAIGLSKAEAATFLNRCVTSKEWFLQLAALKSYDALLPRTGLIKARKLLKDSPSLVVRSEAVHYIKTHGNLNDVKLLFDALLNSKNFNGKYSLSIRPQIIEAIESMDQQNIYRKRWIKLKNDSNVKVRSVARARSNPKML